MDSNSLAIVFTVLLVTTLAFGAILGAGVVFEFNTCATLQTLNPDFNFQWVFWGGCLVQTPSGYWINYSNYRLVEGVDTQR